MYLCMCYNSKRFCKNSIKCRHFAYQGVHSILYAHFIKKDWQNNSIQFSLFLFMNLKYNVHCFWKQKGPVWNFKYIRTHMLSTTNSTLSNIYRVDSDTNRETIDQLLMRPFVLSKCQFATFATYKHECIVSSIQSKTDMG